MNEHDYLLGWGAYAIAALGCLLIWFRMTGWIWRWLREPLRLLLAVLLFTPTIVDPARELFAPAIAITALDLAFHVGNNAWRAVADLAMYGMIAFIVYLLLAALRWPLERWWRARHPLPEAVDEEQPTLRELMARGLDDDPETYHDDNQGRRFRVEPRH